MRVLVIGGTGFIGYHVVRQLQARGDTVAVLCRHTATATELFGPAMETIQGDINAWQTDDYIRALAGFEGVVFAAGADERSTVEGDAWEFFSRANVWPCEQLFAAVAQSNVRHAVLLSSVFAWLHEQHPALGLAQRHPYIRSRVEQNAVSQRAVAASDCVLTTIQVPWIFGDCPHRESQWAGLVSYVRTVAPLMCIRGGANMMSVQTLAQAVCGALHHATASSTMPVGDENLSYVQLMQRLCRHVGRKSDSVRAVSDGFFRDLTAVGHFFSEVFNIESGIELNGMADLLFQDIYFDATPSQQALHYSGGDLDKALAEMVASVPEGMLVRGWRETLNWFARE